jgi:hypothetical protein
MRERSENVSHEHEQLTQLIVNLSPQQVREVLAFTHSLLGRAPSIDESSSWSVEDMEDLSRAVMDHANETNPYKEAGP